MTSSIKLQKNSQCSFWATHVKQNILL